MDTIERKATREAILDRGFRRTGYTDDLDATGAYTERFTHPDGSQVTIDWAPKTPVAAPVQDAPGMYDEPDAGLAFPLPASEEEGRIPGGGSPDDRCPDCGWGTRDGRLACEPGCDRGGR